MSTRLALHPALDRLIPLSPFLTNLSTTLSTNPSLLSSTKSTAFRTASALKHGRETKKIAAVNISLFTTSSSSILSWNDLHILFTLRSEKISTHKGQVSFPGGKVDEGDYVDGGVVRGRESRYTALTSACIRETSEEVGPGSPPLYNWLNLKILGVCDWIPAITNVNVYPVISWGGRLEGEVEEWERRFNLTREMREVDCVFFASISDLIEGYSTKKVKRNGVSIPFKMPTFKVDNCKVKIWGLTAIILEAALERIIFEEAQKAQEVMRDS